MSERPVCGLTPATERPPTPPIFAGHEPRSNSARAANHDPLVGDNLNVSGPKDFGCFILINFLKEIPQQKFWPPSFLQMAEHARFKCTYPKSQQEINDESIDEFLNDYRPQLMDVRKFMVCPEELEMDLERVSEAQFEDLNWTAFEFSSAGSGLNLSNILEPPANKANQCAQSSLGTAIEKVLEKSCPQQTTPIRKRVYNKLSAEKKAERRKVQNREAQRRFREKQLLACNKTSTGAKRIF